MQKWAFTCLLCLAAIAAGVVGPAAHRASAATLCVNQNPHSKCYHTIGAAIAAAKAGDTIQVASGTYREDAHITKALSLIGAGAGQTTINAAGLDNGVFIDGTASAGKPNVLKEITVTGFTVENAKFEGILITNASYVNVWRNIVIGNDLALDIKTDTCPTLPPFETEEGLDCGEGIHLSGVDHSTVAGNTVEKNSGGILISDDTGPTDSNVIHDNNVQDNPFDCGITLASHPPASITHATVPFGVFSNTIAHNLSNRNGLAIAGAGAGVGLFAPAPLNQTYSNVVVGNTLTNNGLPGVAMHNHVPSQNIKLDDNVVTGNYIAGNGPDTAVETGAALVPTGISMLGMSLIQGTVITGNVIAYETTAIAINNAQNKNAVVDAHLNDLDGIGNGVANLAAGSVNATENWWGCASGPGTPGCSSATGPNIVTAPFLTQPIPLTQ
jgi:parallel beta-helix repeat protein